MLATAKLDIWKQLFVDHVEDSTWVEPIHSKLINSQQKAARIALHPRCGQVQTIQWNGWDICYSCLHNHKSQVPIILVHGFGGSIGHWRQNIPELAKNHSVYAIDLLGFGASAKPDAPYSLELWAEQLYNFWKRFVKVPVVLVGNSLGSATCLAVAAKYPEMVEGVAMISLPDTSSHMESIPAAIRPLIFGIQRITLCPMLLQPLFHLLKHPRILRQWASLAYACKEAVTDELLEILSSPARERGSAKAFCAILKAILEPRPAVNIRASLTKLQIPSLLMWGKQDRMVPVALAHRFLSYNPALKLVELDNAGHCAHDERPEEVNQKLLEWIQTQVLNRSQAVEA